MKRSRLKPGKGFGPRKSMSRSNKERQRDPGHGSLLKRSAKALREAGEKKRKAVPKAGLKKVGNNRHSKDWARLWPKLKKKFERAGVTRCERCGTDSALTPAHTLKRRHITDESELAEVAILCVTCHDALELLGEERMCPAIREIIAGRPERMLEAA